MSTHRPLAGLRWSLESAGEHEARHDRDQLRYWLAQPADRRLAQAEAYRVRMCGEGPYRLGTTMRVLPSVVSGSGPGK